MQQLTLVNCAAATSFKGEWVDFNMTHSVYDI